MIYQSGNFTSHDGINIYFQFWQPAGNIRKVICLVHGIGEHSGRYATWAEKFVSSDIAVFSFDLRCHGKSDGRRGDATNYGLFMKDIEQALQETEKLFPAIPVIIYGHSLGGNFVLNYLLRKQPAISGAIVTSPWLELAFKVPWFKITLGKFVQKIFPGLIQSNGLHIEDLTRTIAVFDTLRNDPLVHSKISVRLYFSAHNSGLWALENADKLSIPLLLMHGAKDNITSNKASAAFAEKAKSKTTFNLWKGCFHELHNEPERDEIASFILTWIDKLN